MLSRKVLSLTNPKGKIYKTKSLGHYITYGGSRKNIIQIGEYIMMQRRHQCFVVSHHHQDLDIKIVHIAMGGCWDDRSKWEIYNEKIHKRAHSVHNSKDMMMILFTNPSARAGYDTRSIFKRSLTGLNSEFSFS